MGHKRSKHAKKQSFPPFIKHKVKIALSIQPVLTFRAWGQVSQAYNDVLREDNQGATAKWVHELHTAAQEIIDRKVATSEPAMV